MKQRILSLLTLVLLSFFFLPSAHPHTALVSSTPAADSRVAEFPSIITLRFNEPLLVLGNGRSNYFDLEGPDGQLVAVEALPVNGAVLSARVLAEEFSAGVYRVIYRVVSNDGHVLTDEIRFSYRSSAANEDSQDSGVPEDESEERDVSETSDSASVIALSTLIVIATLIAAGIYLRSGSRAE